MSSNKKRKVTGTEENTKEKKDDKEINLANFVQKTDDSKKSEIDFQLETIKEKEYVELQESCSVCNYFDNVERDAEDVVNIGLKRCDFCKIITIIHQNCIPVATCPTCGFYLCVGCRDKCYSDEDEDEDELASISSENYIKICKNCNTKKYIVKKIYLKK